MECFNDLLHKLQEVHEREVEGWQVKVQELSNKKGCETKRMEELFTRNQQMKEQHRLLTENIKTLENRLRAGLCDRCTVTQEMAKKRQQEFETSHMQNLQHISLMAGEMNNLKMENKKLRDEIRNLRAGLDRGHTDHSSNSTATDVKPNSSPDLSPSSVPVALINAASSRPSSQPSSQPTDGDVVVKSKRTEEAEHRQLRGMSKSNFFSQESYKPFLLSSLITPPWKADHSGTRAGERRAQSVEGLDQRPSIPPQALLLKNASSSAGGDVIPSRHVLHAPVPCRPQPINSTRAVPWPLSESCDWVTATAAAAANLMPRPSSKTNPLCIPSLLPTSPRRQNIGSQWLKQSTLQTPAKEPTVVFRLRNLPEHVESQTKPQEKKEIPLPRVAAEGLREAYEGPLDLSDRGKSKSNQEPRDDSPLALQDVPRVEKSPDKNVKADPAAHVPISSPSPVIPPSSSTTPPVRQQEEEPTLDFNHKASTPAVELISSSDERDEEGNASSQSCKRKRASVETEPDRDSDTEDIRNERTIKITVRTEETGLS